MTDPNIILQKYPWYVPAHIALWQQDGAASEITQIIAMNYSEALIEEESVDFNIFQGYQEDVPAPAAVVQPVEMPNELEVPKQDVASQADLLVQRYLRAKQEQQQQELEQQAQQEVQKEVEPIQIQAKPEPQPQSQQQPKRRVKTALQMLEDAAQENAANRRQTKEADQIIDKFLEVKELKILASPFDDTEEEQGWQKLDIEPVFAPEDGLVNEELAKIYLDQNHYDQAKEIYNKLFLLYSEKSVYFASQVDAIELLKLQNQGPRAKK
ncbi:MAG: hypothetical protein SNH79_04275 [Rikenellaceae bacterium]